MTNGLVLSFCLKITVLMGSTELTANLFRATQTEDKLRRDNIKGKQKGFFSKVYTWTEKSLQIYTYPQLFGLILY